MADPKGDAPMKEAEERDISRKARDVSQENLKNTGGRDENEGRGQDFKSDRPEAFKSKIADKTETDLEEE